MMGKMGILTILTGKNGGHLETLEFVVEAGRLRVEVVVDTLN